MSKFTELADLFSGIFIGQVMFLGIIESTYGRNKIGLTLAGVLFGELLLLVIGGFIAFVVRSIKEHKELKLLKEKRGNQL